MCGGKVADTICGTAIFCIKKSGKLLDFWGKVVYNVLIYKQCVKWEVFISK